MKRDHLRQQEHKAEEEKDKINIVDLEIITHVPKDICNLQIPAYNFISDSY